jgi:hypothetical protein
MTARDVRPLAAVHSALCGFGLALLVLAGQLYGWLKTGRWPKISLSTILVPISSGSDFHEWLVAPQSWYGLHAVVQFLTDLPLFVWIVCCTAIVIFTLLKEKQTPGTQI